MYMLLTLLTGVVLAIMISLNGNLTSCVGTYFSAVIIHIVGTVFAFLCCKLKRIKIFQKYDVPHWAYLGGMIGILTTLFNNFAYARISMTNIIALSLFGQSMISLLIDGLGLFGMKKCKIKLSAWIGVVISLVGVAVMIDSSIGEKVIAILVSIGAGISVVFSRTVNSRLAEKSGALTGSFFNHLVGLPGCFILWLLVADMPMASFTIPSSWMLGGGVLGVIVVLLCNITVPRLPALRLTLLSFLGQVFTGFIIDLINSQSISGKLFYGGVICAFGFLVSLILDMLAEKHKIAV